MQGGVHIELLTGPRPRYDAREHHTLGANKVLACRWVWYG
jgi:hypothetical protein